MKCRTMHLPTIFLGTALAFAQQTPPPQPLPGRMDGILGLQLIAWSELQKPQPVPQQPQPVPPPDTQPGTQPSGQKPQPDNQTQPETGDSAAKSVTGSVVKVAGKYMLETDDNIVYQLDDQEKAKQCEGKRVKISGTLDRTTGILHVSSIELLS